MKRALLTLLIALSLPASAGPTIVESGGYTFLPALKLTGLNGLWAIQSGAIFQGSPPIALGTGIALASISSFGAVCSVNASGYALANCSLYTAGTDTFLNAPTGSNVIVRINNATKATFGTSALLLPSGVDLQTTQGQKLTWDGATAAKYESSDGTTLGLTGLNYGIAQGAKLCFDGQTCSKYASNSAGTDVAFTGLGLTSGTFVQLAALSSLSWVGTSGVGLIASNVTNGLQLNVTGGGSAQGFVQAILDRSVTANTNTNAGETTIYSYSLPASTLNTNTRSVRIVGAGTTANNGNSKTIKVKFGGTTCLTLTTSTAAVSWTVDVTCARTGATAQFCFGTAMAGNTPLAVATTTPAETLSGAVTILITAQATTTADITNGYDATWFIP